MIGSTNWLAIATGMVVEVTRWAALSASKTVDLHHIASNTLTLIVAVDVHVESANGRTLEDSVIELITELTLRVADTSSQYVSLSTLTQIG